MIHLLEQYGDDIQITEEIIKAAAENWRYGKVIILLLEQYEDDIQITEEIVKAAAENWRYGKDIMTFLLERRGNSVQITEGVVVQIARLFNEEVMIYLLEQYRDDIQITEEIIKAAAENQRYGKDIMTLLLERRENSVQICNRPNAQ
jgi:hypothetical protein